MGKTIDFDSYKNSEEEYVMSMCEIAMDKVNELVPFLDEFGIKEITIRDDGDISIKFDFEE